MSKIASEVLIERLANWGVDTIFGLPGDGINGIMEGLRRQDRVRFVLVHHEEAAAFMATGYAKSTGRLGVCLATSGPGAIHLLNGLYDAKLDHAPVLAITGMQETQMLGTGYQQEVALEKLFIDVAEYNEMIHVPAQLPTLLDIAIRHALTRRGVAHLTIPTDIQIAEAGANPWSAPAPAVNQPTAPIYLPLSGLPRQEDVLAAAEVLNAGSKVAMLVGAGALGAREEVLRVAERLSSPVIKTLPGKAVIPDDHPLCIGGIGLLGTAPAIDAMEDCDTLFMVGTNFPYTKYLPEPGQCKVVQIEADPIRAGNRIATEVPMIADAAAGLSALLPHLAESSEHSFLDHLQEKMASWRDRMYALESIEEDPIQPQYLMHVIDGLADSDAILTSDSGTIATWAARHFTIRDERAFYLSGNLATMAPGLPYTIANQIAHPGRQCIAFVGDGGFAMLMAEFGTACRYDLPIKVIVNNNASLGQIMWEQLVLGYPEYGIRFGRAPDFAPWAQACGGKGIRVEKAGDVEGAIKDALSFEGPALVDVLVNPDEPPMPGKVEYEQAKGFVKAFLAGQPRKSTIASTLFRDKITEMPRLMFAAKVRPTAKSKGLSDGLVGIDRLVQNVRHGRFEQSLAGLTGVGALITGVEIWLEHDRASFANRMMWIPVALTPAMAVAGIAGIFSKRAAKTFLPVISSVVLFNSLQGEYLHLRGIAQRPGGFGRNFALYNAEMGPPTFAPLLFGLVGGMGLVASILRRER